MSEDFTLDQGLAAPTVRRRVLVTGAAGNIGSYFAEHARERYELRLMVRAGDDVGKIEGTGEIVTGSLDDLDLLKGMCQGVDTVLHLAANPSPEGTWESILENNIKGTYNIAVAAKAAGCRRLVYASSIHAVSGYPADVQVKPTDPVNPGDLYGVSKCFGEALGRYMAEQEGLSFIAVRIGGFQPLEYAEREEGLAMMDAWVSRRDLHQLLCRCIDAENIRWAVVHGLSDNRFKRLDITSARELLGYQPQDDMTELNPKLKNLELGDTVQSHSLADSNKSGLRAELR
jgi:nucleoside-diphosphate-sugar epimerase